MATKYTIEQLIAIRPVGSRLTPICFSDNYVSPSGSTSTVILCYCECGLRIEVRSAYYVSGHTKSCGCVKEKREYKPKLTINDINNRILGGRLTAVSFDGFVFSKSGAKEGMALFICCCGKTVRAKIRKVLCGDVKSCGCLMEERNSRFNPFKSTYSNMIERCYNKKNASYKTHGACGVIVCEDWLGKGGRKRFYEWAFKNGIKKGLQLDKDIKGDGKLYSPDTCCFVTPKENNRNRACVAKYNINGRNITIAEIAEENNISPKALYHRVRRGANIGDAISILVAQAKAAGVKIEEGGDAE